MEPDTGLVDDVVSARLSVCLCFAVVASEHTGEAPICLFNLVDDNVDVLGVAWCMDRAVVLKGRVT